MADLLVALHIKYCMHHLRQQLPEDYIPADINRVTIVYFVLNALDLLGGLQFLSDGQKATIIAWIYANQHTFISGSDAVDRGGFDGGPVVPHPVTGCERTSNIAMTYASIATLVILGDDLSKVNRRGVRATLQRLQLLPPQPASSVAPRSCVAQARSSTSLDGAVMATGPDGEADVRYVYAAAAVSAMLNLWEESDDCSDAASRKHVEPLNASAAALYCHRCQAPEGGFGIVPGSEAHGGSTFCAAAALALLGFPLRLAAAAGGSSLDPSTSAAAPQPFYCRRAQPLHANISAKIAAGNCSWALYRWLSLRQRDPTLIDAESDVHSFLCRHPFSSLPQTFFAPAAVHPEDHGFPELRRADDGGRTGCAGAEAAHSVATASDVGSEEGDGDEPPLTMPQRVLLGGPGGMSGRPGKPSDCCYSFWISAALHVLAAPQPPPDGASSAPASAAAAAATALLPPSADAVIGAAALQRYTLTCQFQASGGFGKDPESFPDPMHTYYALAGLALTGHPALVRPRLAASSDGGGAGSSVQLLDPLLSISTRAVEHLRVVHARFPPGS